MRDAELQARLDALFAPWARDDQPGLAVGIALKGEVLYRKGFGLASVASGTPFTPRTRSRIASITKHFTGLLALLLAEEGLLDLDAPIRAHLPELVGPSGDPSLRLLLQHRGGVRCYLAMGHLFRGMLPPPEGAALASHVRQSALNFPPGEAMLYSNGGYHLVSIAIERVGRAAFEDQLRRRLFDPLGLHATTGEPSDYVVAREVADLHVPRREGGWRRGLWPSEEFKGDGAIVSTVDDLLRWARHLRERDVFGGADTWAALLEPPEYPDGKVGIYGLGLKLDRYRGLEVWHHAGGVVGGSSQLLVAPEPGLDVVLLANGAQGLNPIQLSEQVVDIVLGDLLTEAPTRPAAADHPALLGDWWSPETGMVYSVRHHGAGLRLGLCGYPTTFPLVPAGRGLRAPFGTISQVDLEPGDDAALITFAGRTHRYRRVSAGAVDLADFARAASGVYDCPDAGGTVSVALEGGRMLARFRDDHGGLVAELTPLGPTVAASRSLSPYDEHWAAITFEPAGAGRFAGGRINTARIRDLAFARAS